MDRETVLLPRDAVLLQKEYMQRVRKLLSQKPAKRGQSPCALVETFGCQQNSADSDKLRGMLLEMGYTLTALREDADLILFNTCAVREHAELKILGNIGALCALKEQKPSLIIGVCGCMMQQKEREREILEKHRHVDLVFGTHALYRFPEMLYSHLTEGKRVAQTEDGAGRIVEGLPVQRDSTYRAWVTIMYGCDNFCSYCIVPYLRGRERSRDAEDILNEVRELAHSGYREIVLLGQNVNSYGRDLQGKESFSKLLMQIEAIPGDFSVQFMTSHPKDCSLELLDTMARCKKVARRLHLPVQSGSDRILKEMNRNYTAASYQKLLDHAREVMPGLTVSSDMIIGFPGETEEDFAQTLALVKAARFDGLYTFAYSKRSGTPAAKMANQVSEEVKNRRMAEIIQLQRDISKEKNAELLGKTCRVLVEGKSKTCDTMLTGRTEGGKAVHFAGDACLKGTVCSVKISKANSFSLYGDLAEDPADGR